MKLPNQVNQTLKFIARNVKYKSKDIVILLYTRKFIIIQLLFKLNMLSNIGNIFSINIATVETFLKKLYFTSKRQQTS